MRLTDVTLDFESFFSKDVSLTKLSTAQYVNHPEFRVWGVGIAIDAADTEWFSDDETEDALNDIDWSTANLVCQNTLFDGYILKQLYNIVPAFYTDTAAMARALDPGMSARLKDLAKRYFPHDLTMRKGEELVSAKGIQYLPPEIEQVIAGYCIQDVDLTRELDYLMRPRMPAEELLLIHLTTDMFCNPSIKLDTNLVSQEYDKEVAAKEALFEKVGVPVKTLSSNFKFTAHIESLDIVAPVKRSPTTGKMTPAFAKKDAGYLQLQKMYPQHADLWKARQLAKSSLEETRALRFMQSVNNDGTFSMPLKYYGAHTGRFSGGDKLNIQNLPRDSMLRRALIAPDGYLVYVADLSAIEARMLAWLAGETELVEQFRAGEDVYSNFASDIYNKPVNKTDNPTERFVGKTAILGLGYGLGPDKFEVTMSTGLMGPPVKISNDEARSVVSLYRNKYWRIPRLWKTLEELTIASMDRRNFGEEYGPLTVGDQRLILPNGLAMHYADLEFGDDGLRFQKTGRWQHAYGGSITENIVQALARIVITDGLVKADRQLRQLCPNSKVAFSVHDELICIAPDTDPNAIMDMLIDAMCQPPSWAPTLPLAAEGGYDRSYSK